MLSTTDAATIDYIIDGPGALESKPQILHTSAAIKVGALHSPNEAR